jgi:hypothetical protein
MPRISKGRRLYKRKAKRKNGRLIANAVWTIRDGEREVATGIFAGEAERKPPKAAEDALVKYITSKYRPLRRIRDIEDIDVADVLAIYHAHREATFAERDSPQTELTEFAERIGRLNDFFGGKMQAEVNAQTCGQYVKARGRQEGRGAIWKICEQRSITMHGKAFTGDWFVSRFPRRGEVVIDG